MDALNEKQKELVSGVRKHAMENYSKGWDVLVECWSDKDILDEIGGARTVAGAIRKIAPIISAMKSRYDEIQAEIF